MSEQQAHAEEMDTLSSKLEEADMNAPDDYYSELYDATGDLKTVVRAMVVQEASRVDRLISVGVLHAMRDDLDILLETLAKKLYNSALEGGGEVVLGSKDALRTSAAAGGSKAVTETRRLVEGCINAKIRQIEARGSPPVSPLGPAFPASGPSAALRRAANAAIAEMAEKYNPAGGEQ